MTTISHLTPKSFGKDFLFQSLSDLPTNLTSIHQDVLGAVSDGKITKDEALRFMLKVISLIVHEAITVGLAELSNHVDMGNH